MSVRICAFDDDDDDDDDDERDDDVNDGAEADTDMGDLVGRGGGCANFRLCCALVR